MEQVNMVAEMVNTAFGGKPMKKGKTGAKKQSSQKNKAAKESELINSIRSAGFDF
jgi:hypothetical protein